MYKRLVRPLLFLLGPERAHHFTMGTLSLLGWLGFRGLFRRCYAVRDKRLEKEVFGLKFPNQVGLAAGFDKDAKHYRDLAAFGFGFVEIGTVTSSPQPGNPKKRLFRLEEDRALINRMGFNNEGAQAAAHRLKKNKGMLIGGNIGKNKVTPNENAIDDYLQCYDVLHGVVDYFAVNVSSPNTPGLRELQGKEPLTRLLQTLQKHNNSQPNPRPILLKIAPDLNEAQLEDVIDVVQIAGIAGVIATNTTIGREGLRSKDKEEAGGLSGAPLTRRATEAIRFIHQKSGGAFPIIGVGGVHSPGDALEKIKAGASLIQLYTGFIYEGPGLVKRINRAILKS